MKGTGFSIRRSAPADAEAIAAVMNLAFGDEEHPDRFTPAWWHWKYAANPMGYHGLVAQDRTGRVVGHYGGVPIAMSVDGETVMFGQNCDSCSDPAVRRGLRNPGLFVRLAQAYASTYGIPSLDAVMYGLPNRDVYRIGSRYLDYWMLRQQWLLVHTRASLPAADEGVRIESVPSFGEDVDALYDRVAPHYRCMARRTSRFLNWRFRDDPGGHHVLTLARDARDDSVRGYAVHRRARLMGHDVALLMDWLCDERDPAAGASLVRAVKVSHEARGLHGLAFICATSATWFGKFQSWGFRAIPSPYMMTARPYDGRVEPRYLREHWYYTLADFDIF